MADDNNFACVGLSQQQQPMSPAAASAEKPPLLGVVPTLYSPDCDKHIAWVSNVFKARQAEIYRSKDRKTVMHCSMLINGGYVYLCDASTSLEAAKKDEGGKNGDETEREESSVDDDSSQGSTVLHVEVEDPDVLWKAAMVHGATVVEQLKEQCWGGTYGALRDPFGFCWGLLKDGDGRKPGVVPYLVLPGGRCEQHVEWIEGAFGGKVKQKFEGEGKAKVQHCEMEVNGGFIYLSDDNDIKMAAGRPEDAEVTPPPRRTTTGLGGQSIVVCSLAMRDPRAAWERLLQNGATSIVDLEVQFWGDLYGTLRDAAGYWWSLGENAAPPTTTPSAEAPQGVKTAVAGGGGGGRKSAAATPGGRVGGVVSYIVSSDCERHVRWIETVLEGQVLETRYTSPERSKVMHCEMSVNGGVLFICDQLQGCAGEEANNADTAKSDNADSAKSENADSVKPKNADLAKSKNADSAQSNHRQDDHKGFILHLNVPDPDRIWERAAANGAVTITQLKRQFWGDYYGMFQDPFGYQWSVLKA